MPTLTLLDKLTLDRLIRINTESFAVDATNGNTWFVEANRCELHDGNLIFLTGRRVVAVANAGTWLRTRRGVRLEDLEAGK